MIRQQVGDLLEIQFDGQWFYVVVLSRIVMFGGTIVFAFYNDGRRQDLGSLLASTDGFNLCTDLLLPKKEGVVTLLGRAGDTAPYFKTRYSKGTFYRGPKVKADRWFIYKLDDLRNPIAVVRRLSDENRRAMDHSVCSFDVACEKILARYSPDQDPRI